MQSGTLDSLDVVSGQTQEVTVPFSEPDLTPGAEYGLRLSFHAKADTKWAGGGFEMAWDQFEVRYATCRPRRRGPPLTCRRSN